MPLHPDVADAAMRRNEGVLPGGDLDQVIGRRAGRQTHMDRRS